MTTNVVFRQKSCWTDLINATRNKKSHVFLQHLQNVLKLIPQNLAFQGFTPIAYYTYRCNVQHISEWNLLCYLRNIKHVFCKRIQIPTTKLTTAKRKDTQNYPLWQLTTTDVNPVHMKEKKQQPVVYTQ